MIATLSRAQLKFASLSGHAHHLYYSSRKKKRIRRYRKLMRDMEKWRAKARFDFLMKNSNPDFMGF
jgi:hypothetical protein